MRLNLFQHRLDVGTRQADKDDVSIGNHIGGIGGYRRQGAMDDIAAVILFYINRQVLGPLFGMSCQDTHPMAALGSKKSSHDMAEIATSTDADVQAIQAPERIDKAVIIPLVTNGNSDIILSLKSRLVIAVLDENVVFIQQQLGQLP